MELAELKFLNAFNAIPGVGAATLRGLAQYFGSFEAAWRADLSELVHAAADSQARAALTQHKGTVNPDREMQKLVQEKIWTLADDEAEFPPLLCEIPYPPLILYGYGRKEALAMAPVVGIVGTRRPTAYGLEAAEALAGTLARAGVTIASGLAMGIDAKAHTATLAQNGATVAVLGSGIDPETIFPPENKGLARRIVDSGGAVISEYTPGTPGVKEHFPMRNRIISGLSRGIVVVEARERSGALITARFALEQNREVFAVPGSMFSATSVGANTLIQEGAKAATRAEDILEELGIDTLSAMREHAAQSLDEKEAVLLDLLAEPIGIDAIRAKTKFAAPAILATLSTLELKKLIRNLGGDVFQKT